MFNQQKLNPMAQQVKNSSTNLNGYFAEGCNPALIPDPVLPVEIKTIDSIKRDRFVSEWPITDKTY